MKNIQITILLMVMLALSCSSTKNVSFMLTDRVGKKYIYHMSIPKGFTITEMNFENERAKVFNYPDSSGLYFSNNVVGGPFYSQA
jgi:hypothetical protein